MKTILSVRITLALTMILIAFCTSGFSQKVSIWKGGTPGMKNEWNCPQNWSTSSVPDEFTNVSIPDVSSSTLSAPVIRSGKVEVNSLFIHSNASLRIEKQAQLVVYGIAEGIRQKNMDLEGTLVILNNEPEATFQALSNK
jgi:hypothetical protein